MRRFLEFSSQEALLGFFRVIFWADSKGNPLTQIWPVGEFSEEFFFGVKTVTQAQILLGGTKLEVTDTVLRFFSLLLHHHLWPPHLHTSVPGNCFIEIAQMEDI